MAVYNQVYGNQTFGTGNWLGDELFKESLIEPYSEHVIDSYVTQISVDLDRIGIFGAISEFNVLDVGSGRQALAFNKLGAKCVNHRDISEENVRRLEKHVEKNSINLATKQIDISSTFMPEKSVYDFVYLQGVIQHVKDPHTAIYNLARSCKVEGFMWLYHYQCGSPNHIYAEGARQVLGREVELNSLFHFLKITGLNDNDLSTAMDDLGCTYRHLLASRFYKTYMEKYGFRQYFQKDVIDDEDGMDLRRTTSACIDGYKKEMDQFKKDPLPVIPDSVDHFEPSNYINSQGKLIEEVRDLRGCIMQNCKRREKSKLELLVIAYPIVIGMLTYRFLDPFADVSNSLVNAFTEALHFSEM